MTRWLFLTWMTVLSLAVIPTQSKAEPLIVDLSGYLVAITTGFTGTEVLLFGSMERDGDVIVIVKGPPQEITVRKKNRVGGIWINTEAEAFEQVPAFYHVAMTENALETLPESSLRRHEVGTDRVKIKPTDNPIAMHEQKTFVEALIRNKQKEGLYSSEIGLVEQRGAHLFRTDVFFPANVPTGTYTIETLLVANGNIISAQNTPLFINKVGLGAQVYLFAQKYAASYGIVAIIIACLAGLGAYWAFRK